MSKKEIAITSLSISIFILFVTTYVVFSNYRPKVLKRVHEVKGMTSIKTDVFPYPLDAVKIGSSQTPLSRQTTFRTQESQENIVNFYKNNYEEKRWKKTNERSADGTVILAFQKNSETINIVITEQDDMEYTIVSIEKLEN